MGFKDVLSEAFDNGYEYTRLDVENKAHKWLNENEDLLERWAKPNRANLPTVKVRNRTYHYEKSNENAKFGPAYFLYGRNGARYGLFRGNESNTLFALNLRSKKTVEKVGRFTETDKGIEWDDPSKKFRLTNKDKQKANRELIHAGMDGNARFPKVGSALNTIFGILEKYGLEPAEVLSADKFRDQMVDGIVGGTTSVRLAYSNPEDSFSPAPEEKFQLYMQWARLGTGYEVVAYLT